MDPQALPNSYLQPINTGISSYFLAIGLIALLIWTVKQTFSTKNVLLHRKLNYIDMRRSRIQKPVSQLSTSKYSSKSRATEPMDEELPSPIYPFRREFEQPLLEPTSLIRVEPSTTIEQIFKEAKQKMKVSDALFSHIMRFTKKHSPVNLFAPQHKAKKTTDWQPYDEHSEEEDQNDESENSSDSRNEVAQNIRPSQSDRQPLIQSQQKDTITPSQPLFPAHTLFPKKQTQAKQTTQPQFQKRNSEKQIKNSPTGTDTPLFGLSTTTNSLFGAKNEKDVKVPDANRTGSLFDSLKPGSEPSSSNRPAVSLFDANQGNQINFGKIGQPLKGVLPTIQEESSPTKNGENPILDPQQTGSKDRKGIQKELFKSSEPKKENRQKKEIVTQTLSSTQYLQKLIQFAKSVKQECEIKTKLSNFGGSRSTLSQLWTFSKSYIKSIDAKNEKEVNTFATRIWESIIHTQIRNTNIKVVERIPPKNVSDQVEKNSINCYILIVNLFRVMGYEKVWLTIVGKTLGLIDFIYKRKEPITRFTDLELIKRDYVKKQGEIVPKYLSKIDLLSYFLFGLCAFDPIEVYQEVYERTQETNLTAIQEIKNYNFKWSYRQYWCLIDAIISNPLNSYFKLILYYNIFSSVYLQIRKNKINPQVYPEFEVLYKTILDRSAKYMSKMNQYPEIQSLKSEDEEVQGRFTFDGDEFFDFLKTQGKRNNEKNRELIEQLHRFETVASVFYYFKKTSAQ